MATLRLLRFPLLILVTSTLIALLLWRGVVLDPVIGLRIDLGNALFLFGLGVAVIWSALGWWRRRAERQAIQEAQRQAAEDRRRFLHRLDHELKNPLTAMRMGLANLEGSIQPDDRSQALSSVEAQALRLSRLAADLRKLAELETRPLEHVSVDVTEVLQEAFQLAQDLPGADQRRLKLNIPQTPWPLPTIQGDRDLLFLALHNLLDNAIKFTPPGGTIEVRAFEDDAWVVFEVADTGPGIPPEELAHVWEELYRGEGARGIPGSGLGLALVRSIVTRHNGQAVLRSRVGQGSVVTLRLPRGRTA